MHAHHKPHVFVCLALLAVCVTGRFLSQSTLSDTQTLAAIHLSELQEIENTLSKQVNALFSLVGEEGKDDNANVATMLATLNPALERAKVCNFFS
jgi:hypothetical protein